MVLLCILFLKIPQHFKFLPKMMLLGWFTYKCTDSLYYIIQYTLLLLTITLRWWRGISTISLRWWRTIVTITLRRRRTIVTILMTLFHNNLSAYIKYFMCKPYFCLLRHVVDYYCQEVYQQQTYTKKICIIKNF